MLPETIEPQVAAEEAGLIYVHDDMPGITRQRRGEDFVYIGPDGKPIADEAELGRIRSLAIPPAYERIWICPMENGHLQATGYDSRGRKQYRYHARFREVRDEAKYSRMVRFGECLPQIRERVDADLAKRGMPREKVLAAVVYLLEKSLIRVGNEEYAKQNRSFGLTTLRSRHVRIDGTAVEFRFLGKSKIKHQVRLTDRRLARIVAKLQELPGQHLFTYQDGEGAVHNVTSADVNAYIKEISGEPFTAKDFRTWSGSVLAFSELAHVEAGETKAQVKRQITSVVKEVAAQLGNTPAVCRKCYIHPAVIAAFSERSFERYIPGGWAEGAELQDAEKVVLEFLRCYQKEMQAA